MKLIEEKEEPLFKRKILKFEIEENRATPSRKEVKEMISKYLNADQDLIVIEKIRSTYGKPKFIITVKQYFDKEALKRLEPKYIFTREEKKEE